MLQNFADNDRKRNCEGNVSFECSMWVSNCSTHYTLKVAEFRSHNMYLVLIFYWFFCIFSLLPTLWQLVFLKLIYEQTSFLIGAMQPGVFNYWSLLSAACSMWWSPKHDEFNVYWSLLTCKAFKMCNKNLSVLCAAALSLWSRMLWHELFSLSTKSRHVWFKHRIPLMHFHSDHNLGPLRPKAPQRPKAINPQALIIFSSTYSLLLFQVMDFRPYQGHSCTKGN